MARHDQGQLKATRLVQLGVCGCLAMIGALALKKGRPSGTEASPEQATRAHRLLSLYAERRKRNGRGGRLSPRLLMCLAPMLGPFQLPGQCPNAALLLPHPLLLCFRHRSRRRPHTAPGVLCRGGLNPLQPPVNLLWPLAGRAERSNGALSAWAAAGLVSGSTEGCLLRLSLAFMEGQCLCFVPFRPPTIYLWLCLHLQLAASAAGRCTAPLKCFGCAAQLLLSSLFQRD